MEELGKARLQIEAEMVVQGTEHVEIEVVKPYAKDLRNLLEETDSTLTKAFLRSFVKRVEIDDKKVTVHYNLPIPPEGGERQPEVVLPIVTPGGAGGIRTPYLLTASLFYCLLNSHVTFKLLSLCHLLKLYSCVKYQLVTSYISQSSSKLVAKILVLVRQVC